MPPLDLNWLGINPGVLVVAAIIAAVILVLTIIWGIRAHQRQILAGREEMLGKTAVVDIVLDPKGMVFIDGEHWAAISEQGRIEPEEEVVITRMKGLKLYVKKSSKKEVSE